MPPGQLGHRVVATDGGHRCPCRVAERVGRARPSSRACDQRRRRGAPPWMATGATCGSSAPRPVGDAGRSPITNTSGWPGTSRSSLDRRPARPRSARHARAPRPAGGPARRRPTPWCAVGMRGAVGAGHRVGLDLVHAHAQQHLDPGGRRRSAPVADSRGWNVPSSAVGRLDQHDPGPAARRARGSRGAAPCRTARPARRPARRRSARRRPR